MRTYKSLLESIRPVNPDDVYIAMEAMYKDKGGMHPLDAEAASAAVEQFNAGNHSGAKENFEKLSPVAAQRLVDLLNTESPSYGGNFAYYVASRRVAENVVDFGKYNHRGFSRALNADAVKYSHAMLNAINADDDGYGDGEDAGNIVSLVFDNRTQEAKEILYGDDSGVGDGAVYPGLHPYTQESFWQVVDKWPTEVRAKFYHALGGPKA